MKCKVILMYLDDRMTMSVEINFVNIKQIYVAVFGVRGCFDLG